MAEYSDREHYIPLRKNDLAELLCADAEVIPEEKELLQQFFKLTSAVFHFEFQQKLENLKDCYAPFDPDSETLTLGQLSQEVSADRLAKLFDDLTELLERANFKLMSRSQLLDAMDHASNELGLNMDIDLEIFEKLQVFVRGDSTTKRKIRSWKNLWKMREVDTPIYKRLVITVKIRPGRHLPREIRSDVVYLKVFKDIPKSSLSMFKPGAKVRMSRLDPALIAYPLATGIALVLYRIGANLKEISVGFFGSLVTWSIAIAFGGYGYKTYHNYQIKRKDYTLKLITSLYYQSLDNNIGVLTRLMDEAEEQECRETYLAWFCLWKYAPAGGWSSDELDDFVESYIERTAGLKIDFEIGDALSKLAKLQLVRESEAKYTAVSIDVALEKLDYKWDNYFKYNNATTQSTQSM